MKQIFQRGLLLTTFILGLAFHLAAQSTQMTIYLNDGTERSYFMSESDHVYFEDNETLVVGIAVNAKSDRYDLSDIRKITCNETEGVSEETNNPLWISPNPVHDVFILRNLSGNETIHIYALDGQLIKSLEVAVDQPVDIFDLPIGIYLVKTERQTLKMVKL